MFWFLNRFSPCGVSRLWKLSIFLATHKFSVILISKHCAQFCSSDMLLGIEPFRVLNRLMRELLSKNVENNFVISLCWRSSSADFILYSSGTIATAGEPQVYHCHSGA